MRCEQAAAFAVAVRAFGAGAARGHTASALELADMQGYLAALAEAEAERTVVR